MSTNLSAPVAEPPPGVVADFYSISPLQVQMTIIFGVMFVIASMLVVVRLYTATVLTKRLDWDSLFLVLSWAASLAFFISMLIAFPTGFGRHYWDVNLGQLAQYMKLLTPLAITYIWPPTLAKLSLLVLYYRIDQTMCFDYCIPLVAFAVVIPTIVYTVLFAGPCAAVGGDLKCLNRLAIAQAITNIVSDAILIVMPIPMISKLNMPMRQRVALGCLLALGSFVVVFSIIRSAFVHLFVSDPDITHTQAYVGIWGGLELNFGMICNGLAMIKPFLVRHFPVLARRIMGSYGSNNRYAGNYQNSKGRAGSKGIRTFGGSEPAGHSYELHSIDKTSISRTGDQVSVGGHNPNIRVKEEYSVEYSKRIDTNEAGDNSSTEEILYIQRR